MSQRVASPPENTPHPVRVARIVSDYLEAVRGSTPTEGKRRPSRDRIERRMHAVRAELADGGFDVIRELQLRQELRDLDAQLAQTDDLRVAQVESAFVAVAKDYSDRHGIAWATWRQVGVHPTVLRAAGIKP